MTIAVRSNAAMPLCSRLSGSLALEALMIRAHSFPRQNLTNSAENLVNSAVHRAKADEIPRLTVATQLKFRGLVKS